MAEVTVKKTPPPAPYDSVTIVLTPEEAEMLSSLAEMTTNGALFELYVKLTIAGVRKGRYQVQRGHGFIQVLPTSV